MVRAFLLHVHCLYAVSFSYDAASRRTSATLPNGVTVAYGYDDGNQLTSLVYERNGTMIGDLTYSYDPAGRRSGMGGTLANVNLPPALTSATYDANNRLTDWGGTTNTYDLNGNLTNDGSRTYTWDVRDRLTGLNGGGITSSYGYDAFNRRTTKTINSVQIGTLYDGFSEVHTTSGSTITSTLLNGQGLDERYARTQGGSTETFLTDALGSTLNLVNAGGALTANYVYEPYGQASQSGSSDTQYRYTGREDDGTGLMYYRARYYNPRTSRFISEDPIGLAGGYNLYEYVGGLPTHSTDPTGNSPDFWGAVITIGLVIYNYGPVVHDLIQAMRKADETSTQCYGGAVEMLKDGNPSPNAIDQAVEAYRRHPEDIEEVVKRGVDFEKKIYERRVPKKKQPPYERVPDPTDPKRRNCPPHTCCPR